jgi:hypothetical protein
MPIVGLSADDARPVRLTKNLDYPQDRKDYWQVRRDAPTKDTFRYYGFSH